MNPGFSERAFEFCYNHNYVEKNRALLATYPHIPSQRQEEVLGYDVEFRLTHQSYSASVFIQHKVSHFATCRSGRNARFYNCYHNPYFRFSVDTEQHNLLCELSKTRGNTYYCAPKFASRQHLHEIFEAGTIANNVILLDPNVVGPIGDLERHNITYDEHGLRAHMHSELQEFSWVHSGALSKTENFKQQKIDSSALKEIAELSDELTRDLPARKKIESDILNLAPVPKAQFLLGKFIGVSWLLLE
ncbi:adenylosuccinate lyase [Ruegeria atlantica]|uniref:adenylosuccinate lyase n=1 Tax=Ruegeria atlantica TaxID=81569 RepID=UPI00147CF099|nr:adenylosuccinate lyase [Ruegeria atlantica]